MSRTKISENYYEHFRDTCEIFKERKFWVPKKLSQIEHHSVDLSKLKLSKPGLLVLDLDECLIHSQFTELYRDSSIEEDKIHQPEKPKGFGFWMDVEGGRQCWVNFSIISLNFEVSVHKRPFVEDFLRDMSIYFDLVLFTAS